MAGVIKQEEPQELTNIDVFEVSLVGSPANQRKFLMMKNRDGIGGNMAEKEETLTKEDVSLIKKLANLLGIGKEAPKTEVEPVVEKQMTCMMDGKMNSDMKSEAECMKAGGDWMNEAEANKEMAKSIAKATVDLQKKLEKANGEIADLRKAQRKGEIESIAKSIDGKLEDNLTYLAKLDESVSPELFKTVTDREVALTKKLRDSDLFKEKGNTREAPNSATAKIDQLVKEKVIKGVSKLAAINEVMLEHPDLYELSKKEGFKRVDDLSEKITTAPASTAVASM